jgi:hypothetical protein
MTMGWKPILPSRGHSSVGRAPALQAGSQGFESPCLQNSRSELRNWWGDENAVRLAGRGAQGYKAELTSQSQRAALDNPLASKAEGVEAKKGDAKGRTNGCSSGSVIPLPPKFAKRIQELVGMRPVRLAGKGTSLGQTLRGALQAGDQERMRGKREMPVAAVGKAGPAFVDVVQQRLNCALPSWFFELRFLSIPQS